MDTLHIKKEDNGFFDITQVYRVLTDLKGGEYDIVIKPHRKRRTDSQNSYLWGVVYPMVLQGFIDAGWDEITNVEQIHEICKARFLTTEAINKHTGEVINFPVSTAKMNTIQFSTYVEQITDFAMNNLNVVIPQPKNH